MICTNSDDNVVYEICALVLSHSRESLLSKVIFIMHQMCVRRFEMQIQHDAWHWKLCSIQLIQILENRHSLGVLLWLSNSIVTESGYVTVWMKIIATLFFLLFLSNKRDKYSSIEVVRLKNGSILQINFYAILYSHDTTLSYPFMNRFLKIGARFTGDFCNAWLHRNEKKVIT